MNVKEQVVKALTDKFELEDDAYSVYEPQYYYKMGLPKDFVDEMSHDQPTTPPCKGVYNLDMLSGICTLLGLSTETMFYGRGRNSGVYLGRILEFINSKKKK